MFTNSNDYLTGRKATVTCDCPEVVAVRYAVSLVAADLDINDAGSVAILPANCVPVGLVYDSDDLDTNGTPTIVASIGFMNAGDTDLATVLATGITASQTGTAVQVLTKDLMRVTATQADRKIGIKFTAAAATKAAGEVGLTLFYRMA